MKLCRMRALVVVATFLLCGHALAQESYWSKTGFRMEVPEKHTWIVTYVVEGSPAAEAGMGPGGEIYGHENSGDMKPAAFIRAVDEGALTENGARIKLPYGDAKFLKSDGQDWSKKAVLSAAKGCLEGDCLPCFLGLPELDPALADLYSTYLMPRLKRALYLHEDGRNALAEIRLVAQEKEDHFSKTFGAKLPFGLAWGMPLDAVKAKLPRGEVREFSDDTWYRVKRDWYELTLELEGKPRGLRSVKLEWTKPKRRQKQKHAPATCLEDNRPVVTVSAGCIFGKCDTGFGTYLWEDGRLYRGDFKDGRFHGNGVLNLPGGEIFQGRFEEGKRRVGVHRAQDGSIYDGIFVDDRYDDKRALFVTAAGDRYLGSFSAGKKHGWFNVYFADGREDFREFVHDVPQQAYHEKPQQVGVIMSPSSSSGSRSSGGSSSSDPDRVIECPQCHGAGHLEKIDTRYSTSFKEIGYQLTNPNNVTSTPVHLQVTDRVEVKRKEECPKCHGYGRVRYRDHQPMPPDR